MIATASLPSRLPSARPSASPSEHAGRTLRWLASAHESAQSQRLAAGERIIAALPGGAAGARPPTALLREIRRGGDDGPLPLLGRVYRRHWQAEEELARALADALRKHPAWPWLQRLPGVEPTLAARLLARLDVHKASTPSAFWAYCGFATVPGSEYRCETCGAVLGVAAGRPAPREHTPAGGVGQCAGRLVRQRGPDGGVRVAQPLPASGERASYDARAKRACQLIGVGLLRADGAHAQWYRREHELLRQQRPHWTEERRHLAALRKMEKLFLAQLWLVWRSALRLPVTTPHSSAARGDPGVADPWSMTAAELPRAVPTP